MMTVLEYARLQSRKSNIPRFVYVLFIFFINIKLLIIVVNVERMNTAAGGLLPKKDHGRWVHSLIVSEPRWRELRAFAHRDTAWLTRELSPEERSEMSIVLLSNINENRLLDALRTYEEWIFPLGGINFIMCLVLLTIRWRFNWARLIGGFCLLYLGTILLIASYHGYVSSLGDW